MLGSTEYLDGSSWAAGVHVRNGTRKQKAVCGGSKATEASSYRYFEASKLVAMQLNPIHLSPALIGEEHVWLQKSGVPQPLGCL